MSDAARTGKIVAAFAAVYVIWGSTYLGIRIGVETLPPFLMAGLRQATAGGLLYVWLRSRGMPAPTRMHWRSALIIGALMLGVGNGLVGWAEQTVPSGLTALLIATTPLWMVLLEWLWHGGQRPRVRTVVGLIVGFGGAGLLVAPKDWGGGEPVEVWGAVAIIAATWGWTTGALYSRRAELPAAAWLGAAMQMLAGGMVLLGTSVVLGEWRGFAWANVSGRSWAAVAYLTVFGSMVAYSAYMWLLKVSTPARVSTTAYANPIIAVILGWLLGGEALTGRIIVAAIIIIVAVILIISPARPAIPPTSEPTEPV
jgi:drug/metabolite transporter (DMT)-like permease